MMRAIQVADRRGLYLTGVAVAAPLLVNLAHGAAHIALQIDAPSGSMLFLLVVTFAPVVGFAISLRRRLAGVSIVAVSTLASLVFGMAFHFVINSPDRSNHVSGGPWAFVFRTTAVLLVFTQIAAIAALAVVSHGGVLPLDKSSANSS
jgi:hypothetical protein